MAMVNERAEVSVDADSEIDGYVEAIEWFIDHPEGLTNVVLKEYVERMKHLVDEAEKAGGGSAS